MKLSFGQNDPPMGESFWQNNNLVTQVLFELCLLWYLAHSQILGISLYIKKVFRRWFCKKLWASDDHQIIFWQSHLYFFQICNSLTIIKRNTAGLARVCLTHWVRDAVLTDTRPKKKYCNNSDENMLNWLLLMSAALQNAQRSKYLEKVDNKNQ